MGILKNFNNKMTLKLESRLPHLIRIGLCSHGPCSRPLILTPLPTIMVLCKEITLHCEFKERLKNQNYLKKNFCLSKLPVLFRKYQIGNHVCCFFGIYFFCFHSFHKQIISVHKFSVCVADGIA